MGLTILSGNVFSDIFSDVIADTIFEIGKFILGRYKNSKINRKDIAKIIACNANPEFSELFDSGIFREFLSTPQTQDILCTIIELKIINLNSHITIFNTKKIEETQKEKEVFEYLSGNIIQKFEKESIVKIPMKKSFQSCFKFICDEAALYINSVADIDCKLNIYFNVFQTTFIKNLDIGNQSIIAQLKDMQMHPIEYNVDEYIAIKNRYHEILAEKNSKAHIYLLDTFEFNSFYVPPFLDLEYEINRSNSNEKKIVRQRLCNELLGFEEDFNDWMYIFDRSNIIYVTGGAGYGKTLFMKKIINDYASLHILHAEEYLVIYGEIKMFFPNNQETPLSMMEFLKLSIKNATLLGESEVPEALIRHYLQQGRCLILFDALDEVEKNKRNDIHQKIISYFKTQNPNNKVCITSRNRGFLPVKDIENLCISPLDNCQIEKYVNNIIQLGKFNEDDKEAFMRQAEGLVRKGFLNSFLVLSLLINIYKAERELPENKLELYQKCFEYIATKREKDKISGKFNWENIGLLMKDNTFIELANLCYPNNKDVDKEKIKERLVFIYTTKFGTEAKTENVIEEFLSFCSDRTELFVPSIEGHFKFFHRSFFEYFYSQYIFTRCQSVPEIYEKLLGFDVDSEVFELTVATLKQKSEEKYQELIRFIISRVNEEFGNEIPQFTAFNILTLSMQVVDDKLFRDEFLQILLNYKSVFIDSTQQLNHEIIADVILENKTYCDKINQAYYDYNVFKILLALKLSFNELQQQGNADKHRERLFMHRYFSPIYYTRVFCATKNLKTIIKSLDDNKLKELRRALSATNKQWYRVKTSVNAFKALAPKQQNQMIARLKNMLGN